MDRRKFLKLSPILPGILLASRQTATAAAHSEFSTVSPVYFGDPSFDSVKGGFRPGEFTLVAGHYHPDRAREFSYRLIRSAIEQQDKNVLVVGGWFPEDAPKRVFESHKPSAGAMERMIYHYSCWAPPAVIMHGIEETVKTRAIDLVIIANIEYIGRALDERKQPRTMAATMFEVGQIAKKLKIPVVGATSLAKQAYNRREKRPLTTDLTKDTDLACDSLVLLYTECDYDRSSTSQVLEAHVSKNNGGTTGTVALPLLLS